MPCMKSEWMRRRARFSKTRRKGLTLIGGAAAQVAANDTHDVPVTGALKRCLTDPPEFACLVVRQAPCLAEKLSLRNLRSWIDLNWIVT